jgi:hypothetical protein
MFPISWRLDQNHCQKGLNVAISWRLDQNHCQKVPIVAGFMAPGSGFREAKPVRIQLGLEHCH